MRQTNTQLNKEQIDEIITKYIVYFAKKNQDNSRYKDADDLYNLLNQNETVYHYESQGNPVWSFEPLEGNINPAYKGAVADAGNEMLYDMIHYPSKSNDNEETE